MYFIFWIPVYYLLHAFSKTSFFWVACFLCRLNTPAIGSHRWHGAFFSAAEPLHFSINEPELLSSINYNYCCHWQFFYPQVCTFKVPQDSFQQQDWWIVKTTLYHVMLQTCCRKHCQITGEHVFIFVTQWVTMATIKPFTNILNSIDRVEPL